MTYAVAASIWIVGSDMALTVWTSGFVRVAWVSIGKGLFFVLVTSTLLLFLVKAQLERFVEMNRRLDEAERLHRVGELAAHIAHDFNNVLMACRTFTAVLRRISSEERALNALQKLDSAIGRGEALAREILTFGQPQPPRIERIELAASLEELAAELEPQMPALKIAVHVSPAGLAIAADSQQLHRILVNLAVNARDAMPSGGTLTLSARPAGRFVELSVSDTGTGIDPQSLPRIFEPDFTTKRTGTGLGLAIVHRAVLDHGGRVWASSTPGSGTTISFCLPAAPS